MGVIAFHLHMSDAADLLCRIVGLLAQRGLQIAAIGSNAGRADGLYVRIDVSGLDHAAARVIATKMMRCIGVNRIWIEADGARLAEQDSRPSPALAPIAEAAR